MNKNSRGGNTIVEKLTILVTLLGGGNQWETDLWDCLEGNALNGTNKCGERDGVGAEREEFGMVQFGVTTWAYNNCGHTNSMKCWNVGLLFLHIHVFYMVVIIIQFINIAIPKMCRKIFPFPRQQSQKEKHRNNSIIKNTSDL